MAQTARVRLHPRHRIDAGAADVAFAAWACLGARGRRAWSPAADTLACLSARSGLDLLLGALDLPPASEVLVSAVTIPDMARIVCDHGLVPVPVDLDPATMAPRLDLLDRLATDRTRAVLVAHLFGGRLDLMPVVAWCRRRGLVLVEDCAQSWRGPGDTGTAGADASLFSFGPIKTATAFGGGLVRVGDPALLARMRRRHEEWPAQARLSFAARVAKCGALVALQHPAAYGLAAAAADRLGHPLDAVVGRAARSCPDWRRRPSAALLAVLRRRLARFDAGRLARRAARGETAADALAGVVEVPGTEQPERTWWLFPVAVDDPAFLVGRLRAAGIDASAATSKLAAVPAPAGRPEADPAVARALLARLVCLPAYPELPERAFLRMLDVVRQAQARERADWRARA
ncbi:MAG: DegT/DnrJ/EryC1/StrS family aminotransferase [Acidimicrobiales bacterium]